MATLNSEEITLCSDSVDWGGHLPLSLIDNMNSEEITLCSDSVGGGIYLPLVSVSLYMHWYFLYIFLLVDCFEWALIYFIEQ